MGKAKVVLREIKLTNNNNVNYYVWVSASDDALLKYRNYKRIELTGESKVLELDFIDKRIKLKRRDYYFYYKQQKEF